VLPSLACAATFAATSHVLYNAPSSTNVIVGVDGLLQGKARVCVAGGRCPNLTTASAHAVFVSL